MDLERILYIVLVRILDWILEIKLKKDLGWDLELFPELFPNNDLEKSLDIILERFLMFLKKF